jgi:hypothetical protein
VPIPAPLLAALIQLGIQGIAELGPVMLGLIRGWIAALTRDESRTKRIEGEPSKVDELGAVARRVVRNFETLQPDWPGHQKETAARTVIDAWNEQHKAGFRKRELYAALSLAVVALDYEQGWDEA